MIRTLPLAAVASLAGSLVVHRDVVRSRPGQFTIPFQYEDARVYVPVGVGAATSWFILDTGAQSTILDERLAASLGIHGRDTSETTGAGAGSMRQSRGDDVTIRVGDRTLTIH